MTHEDLIPTVTSASGGMPYLDGSRLPLTRDEKIWVTAIIQLAQSAGPVTYDEAKLMAEAIIQINDQRASYPVPQRPLNEAEQAAIINGIRVGLATVVPIRDAVPNHHSPGDRACQEGFKINYDDHAKAATLTLLHGTHTNHLHLAAQGQKTGNLQLGARDNGDVVLQVKSGGLQKGLALVTAVFVNFSAVPKFHNRDALQHLGNVGGHVANMPHFPVGGAVIQGTGPGRIALGKNVPTIPDRVGALITAATISNPRPGQGKIALNYNMNW